MGKIMKAYIKSGYLQLVQDRGLACIVQANNNNFVL